MPRSFAPIAIPMLALSLSGCALLHSNVKGGFACAAPHGTCAPSTTIDDAAIKEIEAQKDGPDGNAPSQRAVTHDANADAAIPNRAALRVVYPAWRDGSGHVHKRTVAYVNVGAASVVLADMPITAGNASSGTNLLAIAESAPELTQISPASASQSAHDLPPEQQATPASGQTPLGTIQAQVRDILAKAPKATVRTPITHGTSPVTPPAGDTPFPPQGE